MNTKKKKGNGEGSVYKYKAGYRGQIVVGTDDEGKPISRSVTGKTIKEVNERLTAIKNSIDECPNKKFQSSQIDVRDYKAQGIDDIDHLVEDFFDDGLAELVLLKLRKPW